jgi:isoleucyl-tRNA synthetase
LPLIAPVLTYTVDEVMEHGPRILKKDADEVFDLIYLPLESLTCKLTNAQIVREKFFECVDALKKSGAIKTTMELVIQTKSTLMTDELKGVDGEDWLTVSAIVNQAQDEKLGTFEVDGVEYILWRAKEYKCPRCWKHKAQKEDGLCPRCAAVLSDV